MGVLFGSRGGWSEGIFKEFSNGPTKLTDGVFILALSTNQKRATPEYVRVTRTEGSCKRDGTKCLLMGSVSPAGGDSSPAPAHALDEVFTTLPVVVSVRARA